MYIALAYCGNGSVNGFCVCLLGDNATTPTMSNDGSANHIGYYVR